MADHSSGDGMKNGNCTVGLIQIGLILKITETRRLIHTDVRSFDIFDNLTV